MISSVLHIKNLNVFPICTNLLSADILLYHDSSNVVSHSVSDKSYRRLDRKDLLGPIQSELKELRSFVRSTAIHQSPWFNIQMMLIFSNTF
jgi:hypothetical protein